VLKDDVKMNLIKQIVGIKEYANFICGLQDLEIGYVRGMNLGKEYFYAISYPVYSYQGKKVFLATHTNPETYSVFEVPMGYQIHRYQMNADLEYIDKHTVAHQS